MKYLVQFLIIFFSVMAHSQNNNEIIEKYNLPKEYKKYVEAEPFLELFKKSVKYKVQGRLEEFKFDGFSNGWGNKRTQRICSFTEIIYPKNNEADSTAIVYRYTDLQLVEKEISVYKNDNIIQSIRLLFYNKGGVMFIHDQNLKYKLRLDQEGNEIEIFEHTKPGMIRSKIGYDISAIDVSKLNMTHKKLDKIKKTCRRLMKDSDFTKPYIDFTLQDWKHYYATRDYLKKEFTMSLNESKDLYFIENNARILSLKDEDGTSYEIESYNNKITKNWTLVQYVHHVQEEEEKDYHTVIMYYPNGNVASVRQFEAFETKRLIGVMGDYSQEGSIIQEIKLEEEFNLSVYSIIGLVRKYPATKNMNADRGTGFINRAFTNHGKFWKVTWGKVACFYIDDASGEVYDCTTFTEYTKENYKQQFGDIDPSIAEKKQNTKILIFDSLIFKYEFPILY